MTDDKLESLKKRAADRREAASRKLNARLGNASRHLQPRGLPTTGYNQASLQARCALFDGRLDAGLIGTPASFGTDTIVPAERPAAPTGTWRCIVHSRPVTIDLTANISADGSLTGQGTIIYNGTSKIYEVSGGGDWTALPPDPTSPNWLFKFRMQPSNHAIFSWFASPTQSPNHLSNRFVVPNNGGVVETNCERIG